MNMSKQTDKIVHVLVHSTATLPVHGGVDVPVTTALEVEMVWDAENTEWYVSKIVDTYYHVGAFDIATTPPHIFVRGGQLYAKSMPVVGVQDSGNTVLGSIYLSETTPNQAETAYAKAIFDFYGGRLKYNTATTIEAV